LRDVDHVAGSELSPFSWDTARQALGRTPWLRHVAVATLDRLAEHAVLHRVPCGSILFEQSETPSFAQFLMTGCVELVAVSRTSEALVEAILPIDLLLLAAVLNRQPYLARARVREESRLVLIHADAFRDAVASDHALCLAVLACQAAQFRRQVKLARNMQLRSAEERVGCYLLQLIEASLPHPRVRLPQEKWRIAWQLGMTRETFSRILAGMTRHGLRIVGDSIEVSDMAALRASFRLDPLIDAPEPIVPLPRGQG
jgi:CRP/FNR family transcriptional activator FtrB